MGEPLLNNSILDQFVSSHEQSYEEFLSTFTYLLKEEEGRTSQGSKVDSLRKQFPAPDLSSRSNQESPPGRSKGVWVPLPPEMPSESERVMNESWKAGGSAGNDLSVPEGVKVNKDTDLEVTEMYEERCSAGSFILPGEAEQTVTYCTPLLEKPLQQKFRTLAVPQPSDSKAQKLLGDDVQPFCLDEEFDYDNVALTPKYSEADLKAILQLSEEKKPGTDVKPA
ncbi:intraflagellar transport-associated protein [Dryobates pubescens]|uniref:intraflagellar transport-associated protein n=1 Tax=Dryobates pubescens TaxID=118200 RepID=UPI0023B9EA8B|nr:intraflagellar transport-associated protein [Dryobates pubescens]